MGGWMIFWIVVAVLIIAAIAFNIKDLLRYIKISMM